MPRRLLRAIADSALLMLSLFSPFTCRHAMPTALR